MSEMHLDMSGWCESSGIHVAQSGLFSIMAKFTLWGNSMKEVSATSYFSYYSSLVILKDESIKSNEK